MYDDLVKQIGIQPKPHQVGYEAPFGLDWVGYEKLIDFIKANNILSVDGDFVEMGTFFGGGAYKLSKFLKKNNSSKKLFVADIFDPKYDWTRNTAGTAMAELYLMALERFKGKTQFEIFSEITKDCNNITLIKKDSKNIDEMPIKSISFGFIDGSHNPEYVENDFYLIWNKLSSKGCVAFHDYEGNIPKTTKAIKNLVKKHKREILKMYQIKDSWILFLIKK